MDNQMEPIGGAQPAPEPEPVQETPMSPWQSVAVDNPDQGIITLDSFEALQEQVLAAFSEAVGCNALIDNPIDHNVVSICVLLPNPQDGDADTLKQIVSDYISSVTTAMQKGLKPPMSARQAAQSAANDARSLLSQFYFDVAGGAAKEPADLQAAFQAMILLLLPDLTQPPSG